MDNVNQVTAVLQEVVQRHRLVLPECVQLEVIVNLGLVACNVIVPRGRTILTQVLLLSHGVNNAQTDTSATEMK